MEIRDYSLGDETEILSLFQTVFGKNMSMDYWNWRFSKNPAGQHLIKLMWDENKLVGHYAVSPCVFEKDGEKVNTALSMTTMTHPEYTGLGIFKDLADSLYDKLENELSFSAIWGFPNTNSHYGFIKNLKWVDIGVLHMLSISTDQFKSLSSFNLSNIERFDKSHELAISSLSNSFSIKQIRDVSYLNWRYVENPSYKYFIFEWQGDNYMEWIVIKTFPSPDKSGFMDIYILELAFSNINKIKSILSQIIEFLNCPIDKVNVWINLWDTRHIQLEKTGFKPMGKQTFLGGRFDEKNSSSFSQLKNWYYSFGDSDVY